VCCSSNNTVAEVPRFALQSLSLSGLRRGVASVWVALAVLPLWAALCLSAAQGQLSPPGRATAPFAGTIISE
jgi:threonine/homoserine efflux transporter RhtA